MLAAIAVCEIASTIYFSHKILLTDYSVLQLCTNVFVVKFLFCNSTGQFYDQPFILWLFRE